MIKKETSQGGKEFGKYENKIINCDMHHIVQVVCMSQKIK